MPHCQDCGKKGKNDHIVQYHFPVQYGGSQFLCSTCYQQIKKTYKVPASVDTLCFSCPICHKNITLPANQCPYCHHQLTTVKKEYTECELQDEDTDAWNNILPNIKKQKDNCTIPSTFTLKKPTIITIGSLSFFILIIFTLLYLPAIADTDDEQFIGEWKGESMLVAKTNWEFEKEHLVKIEIDRTNKIKEYYQWDIDDKHIHFSNLDEDSRYYTDINESQLLFLKYPVDFTYHFTLEENTFTLGLDGTELEIEFTRK